MNAFKIPTLLAFLSLTLIPSGFAGETQPSEAPPQDKYEASLNAWYVGDLDQARTLAEELLAKDSQDAMAHAILGQVLDGQGDEESDSHLEQALELGGTDAAILTRVGDLYATRFGSFFHSDLSSLAPEARRQAEQIYGKLAELQPGSSLPIQRLAWLRKTAGEAQAAIGLLFAAICKDPMEDAPHGDLWSFLGNGLEYQQLASFYEGLALSSKQGDVKGRCLNYEGQVLIALGKQLRRDAAGAGDQRGEAERLNMLGEAQDAYRHSIPFLRRSEQADPNLKTAARWYATEAQLAIAELFGEMGDLPAIHHMLEDVRQAIVVDTPPGTDGFKERIDRLSFAIFQASGGEGGSVDGMRTLADLWKWAVTQVDDDPEWWNNYAFFCRESRQYEDSYAAYNRCLELDPENVRLTNDTGLIQLYHLGTDLDRALELFEKAAAMGAAQYPEVQGDEAREAELRSAYGDALLNLGRLRAQRGELDLANEAFQRLETLDAERLDLAASKIELLLEIGDTAKIREYAHEAALKMLTDPDERGPRYRLHMLRSAIQPTLPEENPDPELCALLDLVDRILAPGERGTEGEESASAQ